MVDHAALVVDDLPAHRLHRGGVVPGVAPLVAQRAVAEPASLPARTRRLAGWGLLALLVAVFPANLHMALAHEQLGVPGWLAWGRLPLQLPLMWWVWRVASK